MIDPKTGEEVSKLERIARAWFRWLVTNAWEILPWVVIVANALSIFLHPSSTIKLAIIVITSGAALAYIIRKHAMPILEMGTSKLGKILYAILAVVILLCSKTLADQELRSILQSDPGMFPDAQQGITVLNTVLFSLVVAGVFIEGFIFIRFIFHMSVAMLDAMDVFGVRKLLGFARKKRWFEGLQILASFMMWAYLAVVIIGLLSVLDYNPFQKMGFNVPEHNVEAILIISSFLPNKDEGDEHRFCTNLEPDVLVSPVTTEPMPMVVVAAVPRTPDRTKLKYNYRRMDCQNSGRP